MQGKFRSLASTGDAFLGQCVDALGEAVERQRNGGLPFSQ